MKTNFKHPRRYFLKLWRSALKTRASALNIKTNFYKKNSRPLGSQSRALPLHQRRISLGDAQKGSMSQFVLRTNFQFNSKKYSH